MAVELRPPRAIEQFFDRCAVLTSARPETRATFAHYAIVQRHPANALVIDQDTDWPYLGFLASGYLFALMGTHIGREQLIFAVSPGETFAEPPALDGGVTAARYIAAAAPAEIYMVPRGVVANLMGRDGAFARAIAAACARRLRDIAGRLAAQISRPTISRLASVVLEYAPPGQGLQTAADPLPLMNQTQIAVASGTVKTVANRELAKLESAGAIERKRGRIVRLNRDKLLEFL
jgi:CRP-like cAMP-binding protein